MLRNQSRTDLFQYNVKWNTEEWKKFLDNTRELCRFRSIYFPRHTAIYHPDPLKINNKFFTFFVKIKMSYDII